MNYAVDVPALRHGPIDDGIMQFSTPAPQARPAQPLAGSV